MEQIVIDTLESLKEYFPKLINGSREIAEYLQEGNEAKALSVMPQLVEGLQWVFEAVMGIQNNGFLNDINLLDLKDNFQEMVEALEIGDHVLLADLLQYEIAPTLEKWVLMVDKEER
ncbi:hypothetical protein [Robertmurraya korlensis]|uniref:hypothetical protein n=1 Tax=Robertmurraya korlensis TaxID=519977 RepID=UPI0008259357|nr:hypothetical protein [Robertmurraya korlensis]